jgi:hypothetical protein
MLTSLYKRQSRLNVKVPLRLSTALKTNTFLSRQSINQSINQSIKRRDRGHLLSWPVYSDSTMNTVKKKVKFSLCLINKAPCHEDVQGNDGTAPPFLTSVLDGG